MLGSNVSNTIAFRSYIFCVLNMAMTILVSYYIIYFVYLIRWIGDSNKYNIVIKEQKLNLKFLFHTHDLQFHLYDVHYKHAPLHNGAKQNASARLGPSSWEYREFWSPG